jgi:hypothetical protein
MENKSYEMTQHDMSEFLMAWENLKRIFNEAVKVLRGEKSCCYDGKDNKKTNKVFIVCLHGSDCIRITDNPDNNDYVLLVVTTEQSPDMWDVLVFNPPHPYYDITVYDVLNNPDADISLLNQVYVKWVADNYNTLFTNRYQ